MFNRTQYSANSTKSTNSTNVSNNDNIIYAIVTNNLIKLKTLVNKSNVNLIIDTKNNYTSLHYAVSLPNNDITNYLLDLGANPNLKQNDNYDAYEISLRSGKKYIFEYMKEKQQNTISVLEFNNKNLLERVNDLKASNDYLGKSVDEFNTKINSLNEKIKISNKTQHETDTLIANLDNKIYLLRDTIETKNKEIIKANEEVIKSNEEVKQSKDEIIKIKRNLEDAEKAFNNLLKKQKK